MTALALSVHARIGSPPLVRGGGVGGGSRKKQGLPRAKRGALESIDHPANGLAR